MARKVSADAAAAFWKGIYYNNSSGNTRVDVTGGLITMFLHEKPIARRRLKRLEISAAGYGTSTTKCRLNAVLEHVHSRVYQSSYTWHLKVYEPATEDTPSSERWVVMKDMHSWYLVHPGSDLEQLAITAEEVMR